MSLVEPLSCPFCGLVPFEEGDAKFFFGREKETRLIIANLFASRLTLLYGASGVGKSSVLRAGVLHQLRPRKDVLPILFQDWQGDATAGLKKAVEKAGVLVGQESTEGNARTSVGWFVSRTRSEKRLMILLDQFEDYFLYHPEEDDFFQTFPALLLQNNFPVSFLISIREDSYAKLDRFEGRIPFLFDNYLRIEHLDKRAARVAIEKPIEESNRRCASPEKRVDIEPELVCEVLRQVGAGQVLLGEAGIGSAREPAATWIETPYLQLVMMRLWNEEVEAGSHLLRKSTLDRLQGAEQIVRTHLDTVMDTLPAEEKEIAVSVFHHLVTPSGTRIAHSAGDLAEYAGLTQSRVTAVLEVLSQGALRILRPLDPAAHQPEAIRYEIFHDVLTAAILAWSARQIRAQERGHADKLLAAEVIERAEAERKLARERQLVRSQRWLLLLLALLGIGMSGLAIVAFTQRNSVRKAELALKGSLDALSHQRDSLSQARSIAVDEARTAKRERRNAVAARIDLERANAEVIAQRDAALRSKAEALRERNAAGLAHVKSEEARILAEQATLAAKTASLENEQQKLRAESALAEAQSRALAARAIAELENEPELGLAIAIEAGETSHTEEAETALRRALLEARRRAVLSEPDGAVRYATFDNRGRRVLTTDNEGRLRVWDMSEGRLVLDVGVHSGPIAAAALSPDGRLVVTGGFDHAVRVLSISDGVTRLAQDMHNAPVTSVAFSSDGEKILSAGWDGTVVVWDLKSRRVVDSWNHSSAIVAAVFSPDAKRVATASLDGAVRLWRSGDSHAGIELRGHQDIVRNLVFSPDGSRLATASIDSTARIWDVERGLFLRTLRGHEGPIQSISFSPDGKWIATGSLDRTARVWDSATGKARAELRQHSAAINSAVFSPDSLSVLTASSDGSAVIWDAITGRLLRELRGHRGAVRNAEFSADGRNIVTSCDDGTAIIWDVAPGNPESELRNNFGKSLGFAVSSDGTKIALVGENSAIRIWDVEKNSYEKTIGGLAGPMIESVDFSPDGRRLVTVDASQTAHIWDLESGRGLAVLSATVRRALFSRKDSRIVTANLDRTAGIWDSTSGRLHVQLSNPSGGVQSAEFDSDGRFVVTTGNDGVARIWQSETGELLRELTGHGAALNGAIFSQDGKRVLTVSDDKTSRLWSVGKPSNIVILRGHSDRVLSGRFSPDGLTVATASSDHTARLWDAATGRMRFELRGHSGPVLGLSFSADGGWIVTAGADGTARVWEVRSGRLLKVLRGAAGSIKEAKFAPNGRRIFTISFDGILRVYSCEECGSFDHLLAVARERIARILSDYYYLDTTEYLEPGNSMPTAFLKRGDMLEEGGASWYGDLFHGRRTANGERFDENELTAAHRTLPFGTVVEVRSVSTGRSVRVRINDRGPFVRDRIIDLSSAAAKEIGLMASVGGVAQVEVYDLYRSSGNGDHYLVQTSEVMSAISLRNDLIKIFPQNKINTTESGTRVQVSRFENLREAEYFRNQLDSLGVPGEIFVVPEETRHAP